MTLCSKRKRPESEGLSGCGNSYGALSLQAVFLGYLELHGKATCMKQQRHMDNIASKRSGPGFFSH